MNRILSTAVALAVDLLAGSTFAADLVPIYPAPPPVLVCFWCGFYVGGTVGGNFAQDTHVATGSRPVSSVLAFTPQAMAAAELASNNYVERQSGFIGGGEIGYNWQFSILLAGVETDIQGLGNRSGAGNPITAGAGVASETFTSTTAVSRYVDYLGTFRGRLGVLVRPNLLLYGTAGLAYGGVHASASIGQNATGILPGPVAVSYETAGSINTVRAGWTAGVGGEIALWDRWTGKLEYLYYDLGTVSYAMPNLVANVPGFPAPTWTLAPTSSARFNGNFVRMGLNYKF